MSSAAVDADAGALARLRAHGVGVGLRSAAEPCAGRSRALRFPVETAWWFVGFACAGSDDASAGTACPEYASAAAMAVFSSAATREASVISCSSVDTNVRSSPTSIFGVWLTDVSCLSSQQSGRTGWQLGRHQQSDSR
ncbi:hypothetical protein B0T44_08540 [Nocardia donostiensis]|uniref:Uncharacterized protein n=1 Tax=Nocardia donostiensis TaxID=1538463 RepID=A0A1V2TCR0_9NOCA|nr:hypothetical protein B0T46_18610 [Nocardia donostiensis]OQS21064.1 hypothetical protein B0T44_08540 [Nocardia donostiensis]